MGSGNSSLNRRIKDSLVQSKQRIQYKLNSNSNLIYTKKGQIEQDSRLGKIEIALIHTEELMNSENEEIIFSYLLSYIDTVISNIDLFSQNALPSKIQPEISSIIFSTSYVKIEELEKFKEIVAKKYGKPTVERAIKDWDGKVTEDIIAKTKGRNLIKEEIKIRLLQVSEEKKFDVFL